jgi:hypothetical protein
MEKIKLCIIFGIIFQLIYSNDKDLGITPQIGWKSWNKCIWNNETKKNIPQKNFFLNKIKEQWKVENEENFEKKSDVNELKIDLFPENKPRNTFDREPLKNLIKENTIGYSFNTSKELGFINSNVPLLNGFYLAHINHYPIRIKPDDIFLLIVQAFSNHVNANSEQLRKYFVDFDGKKELEVYYYLPSVSYINKKLFEQFSVDINKKMVEYLGEEILENLTPNFTTTNYNSLIISKLSIMGSFKNYFKYTMHSFVCGNPYIILEGTAEDYIKIKKKAEYLKKYEFEWFIDRIIPIIQKMINAKNGNIDVDFFKNIIQEQEIEEEIYISRGCGAIIEKSNVTYINGWLLKFFAYDINGKKFEDDRIKVIDFNKLANQLLNVPFKLIIENKLNKEEYEMEYQVGFIGCDQNKENEVFPVQGWLLRQRDENWS